MPETYINSDPYPWPYNGDLRPANTALIVIDMQTDFCGTALDLILRQKGIANIVLTGITTDVCVHTTMREANDRGYECVLLEDCCAATARANHDAAVNMVKMQNGVFGAVSNSKDFIK